MSVGKRDSRHTAALTLILLAMLLVPVVASAQEATLIGTVTDSTGGVLPGATVTATNTANGNQFVGVTDGRGGFRMPLRVGDYRVVAELPGFASAARTLEVLVGQQATVNLQLAPSQVQESVTVTGEAPLIETTRSAVGSNVDPRQLEALPVNGRNWIDLTMLAVGARQNTASDNAGATAIAGDVQINIDGLRITQQMATSFGQPRYSRDAIGEFQFIANRFDATQGGSSGVQVNAIMKSGTNMLAGTFSGYFRADKFNAEDFIQKRKIPYQDQQLTLTLGGPIRKDRVHFFGDYEFEREPQTYTHSSPYPSFNFDLKGTRKEQKGGGRVDVQFSSQTRLTMRGNRYVQNEPYNPQFTGGALRHPSTAQRDRKESLDTSGKLTQVLSNRMVNEVNVGYAGYSWIYDPVLVWPDHPYGLAHGSPIIQFSTGYQIGQGHTNSLQKPEQDAFSVRDDLTLSFSRGGRHDLKVGGEFINNLYDIFLCNQCGGLYDARGGPIPGNIEQLFPVWNDISTWNLNGLNPIIRFYQIGLGDQQFNGPIRNYNAWAQDDWLISKRLTLNLGVRYDFETNANAENLVFEPFLPKKRPYDKNNIAPRFGFAYSLSDRTVVRGGFGQYYADPGENNLHWSTLYAQQVFVQVLNDGRPDFATNPFNGPRPTFEQALARTCSPTSTSPSCIRRSLNIFVSPELQIPYSYQGSIGIQKQLADTIGVQADYTFIGSRHQLISPDQNVNLSFNTATGANYPFSDIPRRPFPGFNAVNMRITEGQSNYQALQTALTKRFSNRWQAQATYLLALQRNLQFTPPYPGCQYVWTLNAAGAPVCDQPITLAPDFRREWYDAGLQRNRFVFNGIWDAGYGFQLSGLYFYGDQGKATPTAGIDVRALGGAGGRLRPNGTFIERHSFDIPSLHRVDLRLQRQFALGGRAKLDGIVEVFNLFNRGNYGTNFVLAENNPNFGRPQFNNNVAYTPRAMQLGFRASF